MLERSPPVRRARGNGCWSRRKRGYKRGVVGFGIDVRWRRSLDWNQLQFAGFLIGADDGTSAGIAFEQGQLREHSPVEQDRIPGPVLVVRCDDRGS